MNSASNLLAPNAAWTIWFSIAANLIWPVCPSIESLATAIYKDGSTVRYVGTVRYASIFAKKYGTLVRYAFSVMVRVGTPFS